MELPLVSRRQAFRLRGLGFDWPVKDIFIPHSKRIFFTDDMFRAENWNRYEEIISRPSVALALYWLREVWQAQYAVEIEDWQLDRYKGYFRFPDMREPAGTRIFKSRDKTEGELLDRMIAHLLTR